ncbi:YdiU family protein [Novosphingobium profundi]|uniref:protein adenylyltransferase SelO family protein n=1 Tax=Novosphingobium profundi TaxID=1774954 RepID=UPI001BD97E49|nr:YdiU family protein [Novosphingobium profundi]MBT0669921.1 YdiU family protein [Novosphingobium profundi]
MSFPAPRSDHRPEPAPGPYRSDRAIEPVAGWLADPVDAAPFPQHVLRFRNQRQAATVGLDHLDEAQWIAHFGRFEALEDNLPRPLALRYHGHQFRSYNPDLGDGRGFLFAQLRAAPQGSEAPARLLDLGTKGSGQTPWSRDGDGRLTLKGAVREILATEMLEALGVNTSKTFSVIETGERLWRGDEPSPTRSAVLVRLSHGHIRIGSFQRLYALGESDHLEALVAYALEHYPGPAAPEDAPDRANPAVILLHQVVARLADLAASWMVAGFVHGVLNTDNMNISGESFDYGPWRWAPRWDPRFTAAYFDHTGLYAFGRQPEALLWNCGQLAMALSPLAETPALVAALDRFGPLYQEALTRRFCWRLGVVAQGLEADTALVQAAEQAMVETGLSPDAFFFLHRAGRQPGTGDFGTRLATYAPSATCDEPFWRAEAAPDLHIEEVERIWEAIAERDDWSELDNKVAAIRELGRYLGPAPRPLAQ